MLLNDGLTILLVYRSAEIAIIIIITINP